eukprot:4328553-Pyramimonas_sp.AAC.1
MMLLLADARVGANKEERLEAINARREQFYDARPGSNRLPKIMLTNCTRDGWGNLAGPAYKAAKVRCAAPFFRDVVFHYC